MDLRAQAGAYLSSYEDAALREARRFPAGGQDGYVLPHERRAFAPGRRAGLAGDRPEASWVGRGLSIVTLLTMPPLAIAKRRIDEALGSSATKSKGQQNMLCAYLSAALLAGFGANTLFGPWWADPVTALLIAGVAIKEGREAWRGESCCTAPVVGGEDSCDDGCCR